MLVKTKELSKKYGGRTVVSGLDLKIEPGKILGLLGPNGAGKSTTIKMLTGQIKPTSGSIEIAGQDYESIPPEMRGNIGVMPQEVVIWEDLNIRENLEFTATLQELPRAVAKERVDFLIEGLKLERELKTLGRDLSGGYKRRVNLAISIIHDPSVIFLDEPSPGVDAQTRRFLWEFIEGLRDADHAIVLTDHYLEEAEKLSDYVVIIDQGKVIAEGTVPELKQEFGQGKSLKVTLSENTKPDQLSKLVAELDWEDESVVIGENSFSAFTPDPLKAMETVTEKLAEAKLGSENISISEPTLEDVFIILTGKEIRE